MAGKRKQITHRTAKYPVDKVFPYNDDQLWYDIPGFPSYQFSYKGYIRSFKSRGVYPYGILLEFKHTSKGDMFTLTDRDNFVRSVSFDEIKSLVDSARHQLHPYHTFETPRYNTARNIRAFTNYVENTNIPGKVVDKSVYVKRKELNNKELGSIPTFNNLRDFDDDENIITPIRFVEVIK